MKKCSKCGIEKEATNEFFAKQKIGKQGLKATCKTCDALYREENKERRNEYDKQYQQENKERIAEYRKQYCQENKERQKQYLQDNKEGIAERKKQYRQENKERIAEYRKQHYQDNKESFVEYNKQYRQENKERIAEYRQENKERIAEWSKQYRQENPEKLAIHRQRREARKRQLESTLTFEQWEQIKQDFNHECAYCGKVEKLQQEHFLPLSKGGEYTHNNIVPACQSCNSNKRAKLFHEWYPKYEHYSKKREKYLLQYLGYNNNIQQLSIL